MITVTDERGRRHTHCHGVPAKEWFDTIHDATRLLFSALRREQYGIELLPSTILIMCDDPDCRRLNRRPAKGPSRRATYRITTNLMMVRPAAPTGDPVRDIHEREICAGHPYKAGSCLCESCARVSIAKRLINARVMEGK
jgi:hypothetical protein